MYKNTYQNESPKTYFGGIIWVSLIFILSILGSLKVGIIFKEKTVTSPESITDLILSLVIFGIFILIFNIVRIFKKDFSIFKGIVFYTTIFWGSLLSLNFFFPDIFSLMIFLSLFFGYLTNRKVWIHNILTVLGFTGIAGMIGFSFPPIVVFTFLFIFALYIKGKNLYENEEKHNNVFGLIIPRNNSELKEDLKKTTKQYIIAQAGIFLLPGMLCASVAPVSIERAVIIGIFATFGFIVSSYLFSFEKKCSCQGIVMTVFFSTAFGYLITMLF
jgi:hypothetical protein